MGLKFVVVGLSITSSWGNGHATTYRSLLRELARRGHHVLFLEADRPWYAQNRDMPHPDFAQVRLFSDFEDLRRRFVAEVRLADVVIVGSFVPDGIRIGSWVLATAAGLKAFYDIDTPETIAAIERGEAQYLSADLISHYDLYLSFTGGPFLRDLARRFGAKRTTPLYCSVDPELYYPETEVTLKWDLGYLGTYSRDRQPTVNQFLLEAARRKQEASFLVAGAQYPKEIEWPKNVEHIEHLPPAAHRSFYNRQRFTLNVTRKNMIDAGYSPSVRLFEAAACGTPIISDYWPGLEQFFELGTEVLVANSSDDVSRMLDSISESERLALGLRARDKILRQHSAAKRAEQLENAVLKTIGGSLETIGSEARALVS